MDEQDKKSVDESYKNQVEKEKQEEPDKEDLVMPEVNFSFFISTIGMQIAIALGDMANPADNTTQENLQQAKFLIDTLDVLKEKTKGNLTKEEESLIEGMLYELRMRYIQKTNKNEVK